MWKKWTLALGIVSNLIGSEYLVISPHMSPSAGSHNLRSAHHLLEKIDNRYFLEPTSKAPLWKRMIEVVGWTTFDQLESVCQHEYFGHGFRAREFGYPVDSYLIHPSYGLTVFDCPESAQLGKLSVINVAGLEAQDILAHDVKMDWIKNRKIDPRSTTLFLFSQFATYQYTKVTIKMLQEEEMKRGEGTDIFWFLEFINATYPDQGMSIYELLDETTLNVLDPMVFYAYYTHLLYLITGDSWQFPMLTLMPNLLYLPSFRTALAPYGTEHYFENYFLYQGKPIYLYGKSGHISFGVGLACDEIMEHSWGTLGGALHLWQHGQFLSSATFKDFTDLNPIAIDNPSQILGIALSVKNYITLNQGNRIFIEIAGKTDGYLPGYPLGKSITLQLGYSL